MIFCFDSLLADLLKKSAPSRIVNVSSIGAKMASNFDPDNIDDFVFHSRDYQHSKLCNILFTIELAKRLEGSDVTTYSLHPGFVGTEIFHNFRGVKKVVVNSLAKLFSIVSY